MHTKDSKINLFLLIVTTIVFIWSVIHPTRYLNWLLEVLPAIVVIAFVLITYNKFRLTTLCYFFIAYLSILMFIGGHYTYDDVPLFDWIKKVYHLKRNDYDRFGHFFKGMMAIIFREVLLRKTPLKKGPWLIGIILCICLAIAASYEIIEAIYAIISSGGKVSKDFLGMQGDIWDSQKDMATALIGSVVALLFLSKIHNKFLEKHMSNIKS